MRTSSSDGKGIMSVTKLQELQELQRYKPQEPKKRRSQPGFEEGVAPMDFCRRPAMLGGTGVRRASWRNISSTDEKSRPACCWLSCSLRCCSSRGVSLD